jgi:hypothetical protein
MGQQPNSATGDDFADVNLGDARLDRRLRLMVQSAEKRPSASLPDRAGSVAALEAMYRFLGNGKVSPERIFDAHMRSTVARAAAEPEVLVLHDTTEFRFGGESTREGLGWLNSAQHNGCLGHFSICVTLSGKPLGTIGMHTWSRAGKLNRHNQRVYSDSQTCDRESLRWGESAIQAGERLFEKTKPIHVMDREGGQFELLAYLLEYKQAFVVRLGHNRRLQSGRGKLDIPYLFHAMSESCFFFTRTVQLSRSKASKCRRKVRSVPGRESRIARLHVRAGTHEIFRNHGAAAHIPESIKLNFVEVREVEPPPGEQAVTWRLATTEPVKTRKQVAKIIDAYRLSVIT